MPRKESTFEANWPEISQEKKMLTKYVRKKDEFGFYFILFCKKDFISIV